MAKTDPRAKTDPALYFGKQVRKTRLAAGLTLRQLGDVIAYSSSQISRVEIGLRSPNEQFAAACDRAFPVMGGWFTEFYRESREWISTPPWFRPWVEHEQSARVLKIWTLGHFSGLLQTEDYAREVLSTAPGAAEEEIAGRTAARMARQRVLTRDNPAAVWFLVDETALRRRTRSAEAMAAQLRHLAAVASLPGVTVQVVPPVMHTGLSGSLAVADAKAAYVDTPAGGMVFEDTETVRSLTIRFDTIRGEARPATETAAILSEAAITHERLAQEHLQQ
jgi:transcriptional regulator with XRE-family HTH domain